MVPDSHICSMLSTMTVTVSHMGHTGLAQSVKLEAQLQDNKPATECMISGDVYKDNGAKSSYIEALTNARRVRKDIQKTSDVEDKRSIPKRRN